MTPEPPKPSALSVDELARLLSGIEGKTVTPDMVRADIAAGAPVGKDGRLNLIHYAAWLVKELQAHGS